MDELTEGDIEHIKRICEPTSSGRIVVTQKGIIGCTFNKEDLIDGKVIVHISPGNKLLCRPETLTLKGYFD